MQPQTLRQTLIFSTVGTIGWGLILFFLLDEEPVALALQLPIFFAIIFFTMRISSRISASMVKRLGPKPPPPAEPTPPSSERPDHAERRRRRAGQRRKRRR